MIAHIDIRDFVIVDHLALPLTAGMTVLTGETGAGKSIVVDALGIVLGDRVDAGVVRTGKQRAELTAEFDLSGHPAARSWLTVQELDDDSQCIIRRTVNRDGGSKAYINGRSVTLQQLRELSELLVDIHGQHQHQSLLRKDAQRQLLDDYAGHKAMLRDLSGVFLEWKRVRTELDALRALGADRQARVDLLRFQTEELEALALAPGEWTQLEEEHARLANMDALISGSQGALAALSEDEGALGESLGSVIRALEPLRRFGKGVERALDMLQGAAVQIDESVGELRRFVRDLELDPERLRQVEERMSTAHRLARKHHIDPTELHALLARLKNERDSLENADQRLDDLERETRELTTQYTVLAQRLSAGRTKMAKTLAQAVTSAMHELGMPGGRFTIELQPLPPETPTPTGLEKVEFMVSANPGQPPKPLAKVASGGELSRISLAIQVITSHADGIPTLIFDEVDVGIGGGVAEIVGEKLRVLGERRQVLCVTHLPQVAARGHQHLRVAKKTEKDTTRASIHALSTSERTDEIARMLGGVEITAATLAHAQEMLQRAQARAEAV